MISKGYAVVIKPLPENEGGGFIATVPDLPGCMADGATMEEALQDVAGAVEAWLATAEEEDRAIPMPNAARGVYTQRLPKTLHAELAEIARVEGVSLNQLVTMALSRYVGSWTRGASRAEERPGERPASRGEQRTPEPAGGG